MRELLRQVWKDYAVYGEYDPEPKIHGEKRYTHRRGLEYWSELYSYNGMFIADATVKYR